MATKWKNFTRNCWVKAVAWMIILAMAGVAAWQTITFALYLQENPDAAGMLDGRMLWAKEIPNEYLSSEMMYTADHLITLAQQDSKDSIMEGKGIDEVELCQDIYNEYFEIFYNDLYDEQSLEEVQDIRTVYPADEGAYNYMSDEQLNKLVATAQANYMAQDSGDIANFRSWLGYNRGVYEAIRQQMIQEQLAQLTTWEESEKDFAGYDYYIECDATKRVVKHSVNSYAEANNKLKISKNSYSLLCAKDGSAVTLQSNFMTPEELSRLNANEYLSVSPNDIILVAMRPETLDTLRQNWAAVSGQLHHTMLIVGIAVLVILFCLVVLIFGAGRKPRDCEKYLTVFDRIWTEVQLILFGIAVATWFFAAEFLIRTYTYLTANTIYAFAASVSAALAAVFLLVFLSQVRLIKSRKWLKNWVLWRAFVFVFRWVRDKWLWICRQFRKTRLRRKLIILAVALPLACAVWIPIPFIIAGLLYYGMRSIDRFEEVTSGAQGIRAGNNTHISIKGGGQEITQLADNLNYISEGLEQAVSTAVKSERLKSELISNVSHDIKTPLTSIITYVDLLKKCDLQDETAKEYVSVLEQKANRLQTLTTDLFDASKATSGAMNVDLAQTDFDALLRQALGERSAHLEKAGLDIRIQSQPPVYVRADGRLLWRILDNLISNCARYALPNSRVYISIQSDAQTATLTMKNISAVELNMPADELMQRFTRGDRSRHTEGSGLGLSIAQSLAELMHGSCHVEIDGDLFKSIVTIPLWD